MWKLALSLRHTSAHTSVSTPTQGVSNGTASTDVLNAIMSFRSWWLRTNANRVVLGSTAQVPGQRFHSRIPKKLVHPSTRHSCRRWALPPTHSARLMLPPWPCRARSLPTILTSSSHTSTPTSRKPKPSLMPSSSAGSIRGLRLQCYPLERQPNRLLRRPSPRSEPLPSSLDARDWGRGRDVSWKQRWPAHGAKVFVSFPYSCRASQNCLKSCPTCGSFNGCASANV